MCLESNSKENYDHLEGSNLLSMSISWLSLEITAVMNAPPMLTKVSFNYFH